MRAAWVVLWLAGVLAACAGSKPRDGGAGDAPRAGAPCTSTASCPAGTHCTTDDGACNRPPGCGPQDMCAAVCYGVCARNK